MCIGNDQATQNNIEVNKSSSSAQFNHYTTEVYITVKYTADVSHCSN